MSLRNKTLLIIGSVVLGLLLILSLIAQSILLNSYEQLEIQSMTRDVERVLNSLDDDIARLGATTVDYARWDDTFAFVGGGGLDEDYIGNNFNDDTFINQELTLVLILNSAGTPVFEKAFDLNDYEEAPLPAGLERHLPALAGGATGVFLLDDGPLLAAARPITDSLGVQQPNGVMVFGRLFNNARITLLSQGLRLPVALYTGADIPARLSPADPVDVWPLDGDSIAGAALVSDVYGQPALAVQITLPREIYRQGQESLLLFIGLLLAAGAVFGGVSVALLELNVLSPLTRLSRSVEQVGVGGSQRLPVRGNDELANLGRDINHMLDALDDAQARRRAADERLRAIVSSAPIMLWSTDTSRTVTLLEGRAFDLLGIVPENAIGQPITEVFINIPQMVQEIDRALRGETLASIVPISSFLFDCHYQPIYDDEGRIIAMIGVATDITERMVAETALGEAYEDLEKQRRQLNRMRELLRSTVDMFSDTIKRGAPKEELGEYFKFVEKQFDQLG